MKNKPQYLQQISDGKPQESPIYIHPQNHVAQHCMQSCFQPSHENMKTIQEQILESFQRFENKSTLGIFNDKTQKYDHITYKDILEHSTAIGSQLSLENSIKQITDQQGNTIKPLFYGFTSCPFYETLGPQGVTYTLNLTQVSVCFIDQKTAKSIAQSESTFLKTVVLKGDLDQETIQLFTNKNIQIITFDDFLQRGRTNVQSYPKVSLDHTFCLIFTSGSTGLPKAVVWNHFNFGCVLSSVISSNNNFQLTETDVCLQHIPMPHSSEKILHLLALLNGSEINFQNAQLFEDFQRCKPTILLTVPQIYNLIYDQIQNWINSQQQREQIKEAILQKIQYMKDSGNFVHKDLDDRYFQYTKNILGGRQRLLITMAAPISPKVLDFLKVTLCCQIHEIYGQTEASFSMLTASNDTSSGHVGGPALYSEFKLISVPQMDYYTDVSINGKIRGEICVRGKTIISGYWQNPIYTAETFDEEGWVHTGDIGEIFDGRVKIIDRKNYLFKLSQGYWVSPQKIENTYRRLKGISEVAVFGDPLKCFPVAIVVPDKTFLKELSLNIEADQYSNQLIRKKIFDLLIQQSIESELNEGETIGNLYLEASSFSSLGLTTETLKLQRHKAKTYYQNTIKGLYEELEKGS